jgi:hypothetical protein
MPPTSLWTPVSQDKAGSLGNVELKRDLAYDEIWVRIATFESSNCIVGTGFWRAPEVLNAVRDNITPTYRQLWTCMVLGWCIMSYSLVSFTAKAIVCQTTSWCCQEEHQHQSFLITWTLRSPNYCKTTVGTWILANGLAGTRSMKSYVQKGVERDLWNPRCTGYSQ